MPASERGLEVVGGWVEKAENDLKIATLALGAGEECPADTVAFHAQQCMEKYLKAYIVSQGMDFPRTHDLEELIAVVDPRLRIGLSVEEQRRFTAYATVTRYPGDYEPISLTEARRAVAAARRVRKEIRRLLPKKALRQIKK